MSVDGLGSGIGSTPGPIPGLESAILQGLFGDKLSASGDGSRAPIEVKLTNNGTGAALGQPKSAKITFGPAAAFPSYYQAEGAAPPSYNVQGFESFPFYKSTTPQPAWKRH
jgi:hypothetical protein